MLRHLEDNRYAILFFVLWGLLASLQFFILGDNSYIRSHDNGDSNHPKTYANLYFPNQSEDQTWQHWHLCGVDGSPETYRRGLYAVVQQVLPGWGGHALLLILQRICAGLFMFLMVRRTLGQGLIASLSAGMLYPLLTAMAPLGIYHALGEPLLPGYIFALNELIRSRKLWAQIIGGGLLGLLFSSFSSMFVSQPFLLVVIVIFLILIQRLNIISVLPAGLAFLTAIVLLNLPSVLNTWEIKDSTQRMLLISEKAERTFLYSIKYSIHSIKVLMRTDGVPVLVCLIAILFGSFRRWLFSTTFIIFLLFGVFSAFIPYFLTSIFDIDFFKAYNIRRFYFEYPFFLYIAAGIGSEFIAGRLSQSDSRKIRLVCRNVVIVGLLIASAALISIRFYSAFRAIQVNTVGFFPLIETKRAAQVLTILVFFILTGFIGVSAVTKRRQLTEWLRILVVALLPFYVCFYLVERLSTNLTSGENYQKLFNRTEYQMVADRNSADDPYRVASAFPSRTFHPAYALISGLETTDGYATMYPVRYHLFWKKVIEKARQKSTSIQKYFDTWGQRVYLFSPFGRVDYPPDDYPTEEAFDVDLLSLANTKYIFSRLRLNDDRLMMIDDRDKWLDLLVYENKTVLPRFFLVNRAVVFSDSSELLDSLSNAGIEILRSTAFLEAPHQPLLPDSSQTLGNAKIDITTYSSDIINLTVEPASDALLIITNNWSPYWEAAVDGINCEVFPADFTFQCVYLPSGSEKVELRYVRKRKDGID